MKYMCREFPDEFVVEANSVEEAEEILDCMGCYMQDEEDGTIPCDGPVPVERGMSKKMCEIYHKNSDEVPDREEIRPVIKAAPDMLEALEKVIAITENLPVCPFCNCALDHRPNCLSHEIDAAIRKAKGEE